MKPIPNLHDATLKSIAFDWPTATIRLSFQTGIDISDVLTVVAQDVTDLRCPRVLPWGPSNSVNEVTLDPQQGLLAIEMQSGDVIQIACRNCSW